MSVFQVGDDRAMTQPFTSLGEQLQAIAQVGMEKADTVTIGRLRFAAAASGASATVGSDGGFLVQRDLSTGLIDRAIHEADLASKCTSIDVGPNSNGVTAP